MGGFQLSPWGVTSFLYHFFATPLLERLAAPFAAPIGFCREFIFIDFVLR
jgi:hypothetical protein